ncbi:hypothetical protein H4CHR_02937 [Variovorax sp. PBS-H4]|uniref:hypothetical protein n=1 Tax=Variovorax sp. PBS-H4 TaxID=434008 RepID=UPI0013187D67|nr:hypothetical protein [Variovorax sp. PBS-H4]VTU32076.1 hypothetical protein H4CHR_02937 [Variovorax sp. PBS-H4]
MAPDIETMTDHEREAFWITNLRAALAMMMLKAEREVSLSTWGNDCGTLACFGGWLPYDEHFKALGVTTHPFNNAPHIDGVGRAFDVADYLFGDFDIFDHRTAREHELDWLSDRDIVIRRITNRMRQLGAEA